MTRPKALGTRYDLKAFEDAVAPGGNAPLDVMARNVARYITAAGAPWRLSARDPAIAPGPKRADSRSAS